MGHRLSKIYTRTGDKGTTGLGDGSRVKKSSIRIRCIGALDELNSSVGILISHCSDPSINELLTLIQHHIFDLGGDLCLPGQLRIPAEYTDKIELELDKYNAELSPLKEFILPGGSIASSFCHQSRTICRRVECEMSALAEHEEINPHALTYINRLSDLFFVLARILNKSENIPDVLWQPGISK